MPWCPQCKSEYREGFKICSDCNIELVDSLAVRKLSLLVSFTDKQTAEKFNSYLTYSKIYSEMLEENEYLKILVESGSFKEAVKALNAYIKVEGNLIATKNIDSSFTVSSQEELMEELEELKQLSETLAPDDNDESIEADDTEEYEAESDDEDEEVDLPYSAFTPRESVIYQSKENKAEENYGTGIMLICAGAILIAFTLTTTKSDQLLSFSPIMRLILSLLVILYGIYSIKHSKTLREEAVTENKLVDDINTWMSSYILKEDIIAQDVPGESFETNYFKRIAFIKNRLLKEYPTLEENFADELVEKFYDNTIDE